MLGSRERDPQELQQRAGAVLVTVPMLALEPANRVKVGRLRIGAPVVDLVGVLMHPGTSHVMFTTPQRLLVKAAQLECAYHLVFSRPGDVNAVFGIAIHRTRFAPRCGFAAGLCLRWRKRETIHDFRHGVASRRVPLRQLALKRRV